LKAEYSTYTLELLLGTPFEAEYVVRNVVRKILDERIIRFFTKHEQYLRAKHLEGAQGKCLAQLPLNTPLSIILSQWFLTFFLPRLPEVIGLCFKTPLILNKQ